MKVLYKECFVLILNVTFIDESHGGIMGPKMKMNYLKPDPIPK